MAKGYTLKTIHSDKGLFDDSIDATYILHLVGNGREPSIYAQLDQVKPTKTIHIVYNPGYKSCDKGPGIDASHKDLSHAVLWIFADALAKNYQNILVLEDDFFFDKEGINEPENIQNINQFVRTHKDESFLYLIGSIPGILYPYNQFTYRGVLTMGMHSVIYSKKCMEETLQKRDKIEDIDAHFAFWTNSTKYVYWKPLCYQLFPETENSKNWGRESGWLLLFVPLIRFILQALLLDKQAQPGFGILYFVAKLWYWVILVFIIWVAMTLMRNIRQK